MLHGNRPRRIKDDSLVTPSFGSRICACEAPKYRMPDAEIPAKAAYQIVRDETMLDGNARLNLATFVTTWMEDEARALMLETAERNMIDKDEYPQTAEIEARCVNILADLFNAPEHDDTTKGACGCSTTGSSEAAMLCGMAMKWKWRARRKAQGKPADKPNMVMSIGVQVCWEKFCRYWEIEPRYAPFREGRYTLDPAEAMALCDENTIGVVGILGVTYTGAYEDIAALDAALEKYNSRTGHEVPLHVDAASGGFVAPFIQPELAWDFRLKWVKSINVSGHKYGLVYPGVGWAVWRDWTELPEELIFRVNYLGGEMPTFALNFSRAGSNVVAQYYNFLRLGREGYRRIQQTSQDTALYLSDAIAAMGPFELISRGDELPVFCWKLKEPMGFTLFDLAERLRHRGWQVPAYTMPENVETMAVQRIVVREDLRRDMASLLLEDIEAAVAALRKCSCPVTKPADTGKTHKVC